jgi:hypothetical protein
MFPDVSDISPAGKALWNKLYTKYPELYQGTVRGIKLGGK